MKKLIFLGLSISVLSSFLILSCDRKSTSSNESPNPLDLTPRENEEAEWAALWMSGEIVAPENLYLEVLQGFELLRSEYSDSIPEVNIPYISFLGSSGVIMSITDSGVSLIRSGEYNYWDSLNAYYRMIELDTTEYPYAFYVRIDFHGRLNGWMLSDMYEGLPEVIWADPSGGMIGDWPCTYPWKDDSGNLTFLVRDAWGDCPAGCGISHFYYFKVIGNNVNYIGDWEMGYPRTDPPDWWDEAKIAYESYR